MKHGLLNVAALAFATAGIAGFATGCKNNKGHDEHGKMECKECADGEKGGMAEKGEKWKSDEIKLTDAPAPVQAAVAAFTAAHPGAKVEDIKKEEEDGKVSYEVGLEVGDVDHSLKVAPDGTVLEEETEVEVKDLPAAVSAAAMAKYPKASVEEAWTVKEGTASFYELTVEVGKDKHELKINADGTVTSDEKMEKKWDKGGKEEKDAGKGYGK